MEKEITAKLKFNRIPTMLEYFPYAVGMFYAQQIKKSISSNKKRKKR